MRSVIAIALLIGAGCTPAVRLTLPAGPGTPLVDLSAIEADARRSCLPHAAVTADLRLSGRIDGDRVRGTLQVGVAREAMRLEGLAPFGAPVFVLAAQPQRALLFLPRESAVVRGTSASELLDAVVGIALTPADLLAIVTGCGLADWQLRGGAAFGDVWTRLDLDAGRTIWLRRGTDGVPVVMAATDAHWRIEYTRTGLTWPTAIRLQGVGAEARRTDARFVLDAPDALPELPDAALHVEVPDGTREVTTSDLRTRRTLVER